ncbi:hypothetical protein JAO10_32970 [Burkholderia contaminans]|uniref:hypothetical protein n=1 Tax=Burkholderia contaminans TaxID=488447 RepID=UPI0018DC0B2A|nr:hypothetical protein [Burkholderia contaminans]MBH9725145.1 hypothetical protein [Burkholderia contaminans]
MMKSLRQMSPSVADGIAYAVHFSLVLCGIVAAWKVLLMIGGSTSSNAWNVMVAIGTVASAMVALWLGLRDGFRRTKELKVSGQLVAAGLQTRLKGPQVTLTTIQRKLNGIAKGNPIDREAFAVNARAILDLQFTISHDEIVALAGVSQRAAVLLSSGLATITLTQDAIMSQKHDIPGSATSGNIALLVSNLGTIIARLAECRELCLEMVGNDANVTPVLPSD